MITYETKQQIIDISKLNLNGSILDIGGGGEGIISRCFGDKVIAIDIRKDELEETPDIGLKIIMDACDLKFLDESFENITCFFSLMYMDELSIKKFLKEAMRVMKSGGELLIWDTAIPPKADADIFVAQLKIVVSIDITITTGYGVSLTRSQSLDSIRKLCKDEGFKVRDITHLNESFLLRMCK
ncbi:MAG: class I SAM-dependent methyltransferase [Defluviitaleaceae bacterium]|nr:class I SAM-dependent methyltransferase [Defluviitaleaceae bacterium]